MNQSIPLCHRSKLFQTAHRNFECKYFFVVHKADVPQRIQCALIKVAGLSCFCGAASAWGCCSNRSSKLFITDYLSFDLGFFLGLGGWCRVVF